MMIYGTGPNDMCNNVKSTYQRSNYSGTNKDEIIIGLIVSAATPLLIHLPAIGNESWLILNN